MQSPQADSGELRSLAVPYNVNLPDLTNDIVLVGGTNVWTNKHGCLRTRPGNAPLGTSGTADVTGTPTNLTGRIDRLVVYETIDTPSVLFLVASVYGQAPYSGTMEWSVWYYKQSATQWEPLADVNRIQHSHGPHEMAVANGRIYIRGWGDSLNAWQAVIFNGSSLQTSPWGIPPPTSSVAMTSSAGWTASSYPVTVNTGWYYTYTVLSASGQESCRAPLQTNPSLASSFTGPFTNKCPAFTITPPTDTTNYPALVIYRTTDGGGTFYRLGQATNTGSSITYTDRNWPDGTATPTYPTPDSGLDLTKVSPTLTSNSPPPTVPSNNSAMGNLNASCLAADATISIIAPIGDPVVTPASMTIMIDNEQLEVTGWSSIVLGSTTYTATLAVTRGVNGTVAAAHANSASIITTPTVGLDTPQQGSRIANYAGRLWYAIGNVLFYSGNEEITAGVPQESWPSGILGNFYRLPYPITNVEATSEALYIFTTKDTWWVLGSSLSTFQMNRLFGDVGGAPNQNLAITTADKNVVWLTSDYRIASARGYSRFFLSDALGNGWPVGLVQSNLAVQLVRYSWVERDMLIVNTVQQPPAGGLSGGYPAPYTTAPAQYVFDFNQGQGGGWFPPWSIPASCMCNGFDFSSPPRLFSAMFTGGGAQSGISYLLVDTPNTVTDNKWSATAAYASSFRLSLVRNPTGNHINALRLPAMVSVLNHIKLDRTVFTGDSDPTVTYTLDDSTFGTPLTPQATLTSPPRRTQSIGYKTLFYEIDSVCERVTVQVANADTSKPLEIQGFAYVWDPGGGA